MNFEVINKSDHICIKTDSSSFANASALYTYILTLHKKVSMVSEESVDMKFSYLPWFDKIRDIIPSSADVIIKSNSDTKSLYEFFILKDIKINKKMATALYSSLLVEHKSFQKSTVDSSVFLLASRLIDLGAEDKKAYEYLNNRVGLNIFRLREILLKNFLLTEDGTHAKISISDKELHSSGSDISDVYPLLDDFLTLVNVKKVTLMKSDQENNIITNIKEK
jgi:phosphoesterase RecJ-like protein